MVTIVSIAPSRFREGDEIAINGFNFSPNFGDNVVAIDDVGVPITTESDTRIVVTVPAGLTKDAYVAVKVQRSDTSENDALSAWHKADLDDIRGLTSQVPGQVPGVTEAADPTVMEDVPQAQDYERIATALEHLLQGVLSTVGDLFAFDGSALAPHAVGVAGETLEANPATSTGMDWGTIDRAQTLGWQGQKAAGANALSSLTANGPPGVTGGSLGIHLAPFTGTLYGVAVLFQGTAGDTLDQVRVLVNGGVSYDSGTGLAIAPDGSHTASFSIAVTTADDVEVQVATTGSNGATDFIAIAGIRS